MIRPGDRIGHVRVEGPLAEGGMGAVYAGFDEKLRRPVALKAIRGDRLDAAARSRFLTEARLLSQLDHPNVCRIHGFLESGDGDFLVLERIHGRTLREILRQTLCQTLCQTLREEIPPGIKLAVAEGVARALEAAHEKGIVHRDLKPDNVMLTHDGQVKVLDFGLARSDEEEEEGGAEGTAPGGFPLPTGGSWWVPSAGPTRTGALVGTPANMSPEQARGEPATPASDACALGLLLQELFTGRPPYAAGLSEQLLLVKAADGDSLPVQGIDADLAALIRRLKAVAPEARPLASAAAERLAWIRGKPRRRRLRLLAAVVAAAFAFGGIKYVLDLKEERQLALIARRAAEQEAARADATARFLEELFQASDPREARGRVPDARELLRRGTERLGQGRELLSQPLLRAELLDTLGGIQTSLGLFDEARPLLKQALAIRERLRGRDHPEVAATLVRLGSLAQLSGKGDAVILFRRALAIREESHGSGYSGYSDSSGHPAQPAIADVLNKLGMTVASRGRLDEAEEILMRSLALHEKLWGKSDLRVAKVLHNLAGIAYFRERTEDAERLLRRALAIRQAQLPDDHPDLVGSREVLALLLQDRGRTAEAEKILTRLAATAEKVYGSEHPELARTLLNLGRARAILGRDAEARRLFERSLAIDKKSLEPGHPQLLRARETLAQHCREGHGLRDDESRELCRRHGP